ncbi:conserved domain protein [Streptococcus infantis X]|uniref:Conserved domain protein n=1 Tax=Streptococcus infantis X TaxID=997830 RepID=F9PBD6_9STRE|nr:conserved domain protein [Streptococcus infantis X]
MRKHLTIFRILYLLFLVFALIHFVLGLFGLAFTPGLWNLWFFGLSLTLFIQPWTIFIKRESFNGII